MSDVIWLLLLVTIIATLLQNLRWWRVAQREHYLPGVMELFTWRWWFSRPINVALAIGIVVGLVGSLWVADLAFVAPLCAAAGPIGLSSKGRTSKLAWTQRMKSVAVVTVVAEILAIVIWLLLVPYGISIIPIAAVSFVELALVIRQPIERRKAAVFVEKAKERLAQVRPTVVGITGSYGKTSTKGYLAHLLAGTRSVLPTPASFNNRAGLSRAINEHLSFGTEVFIAEMGTYGPSEIRELCEFVEPSTAMITAIGPVHLERFKTEEAIVEAKAEIFENTDVCILNVDDPRLDALAARLASAGKRVRRCGSAGSDLDVRVVSAADGITVTVDGEERAHVADAGAPATNLACAIAAAIELGVSLDEVASRCPTLPVAAHRQAIAVAENGVTVIDDTFNANPASVRRGLELLAAHAPDGRRIVVTPGMVELGNRQKEENGLFAQQAGKVATDLVVVGRTNRRALLRGAKGSGLNVVVVDYLPRAVEWVRNHSQQGDAVLYANDLPDHFP